MSQRYLSHYGILGMNILARKAPNSEDNDDWREWEYSSKNGKKWAELAGLYDKL